MPDDPLPFSAQLGLSGFPTAQGHLALVTMPFVSVMRPSLQLGILKRMAEQQHWYAKTFHFNIEFARRIGLDDYEALCVHRGFLIGDWLFSHAAYGDAAPDQGGAFLEAIAERLPSINPEWEDPQSRLLEIREIEVPAFIEECVDATDWARFDLLGFTSTFQQNTASFALARALKQRFDGAKTIFGGANFEADMGCELTRITDVVDWAIIGEAEHAFPAFLDKFADGQDLDGIPGLVGLGVDRPMPSQPVTNLDASPIPDYTEYFERLENTSLFPKTGLRDIALPFETSRGCWWGAKHHCTFCGLNGQGMGFRSKSPERVLTEIAELTRRYRSFRLEAVDNILDLKYLRTVFPALIKADTDYQFFYEVKSNLTRQQLRTLRQGGVHRVQPGIESVSSHVLGLMDKGVTAAQNVNFLRWAHYYGISVGWNLIWGFPGETVEDYDQQAELMRQICHLEPPGGCGPIWMERFSPMFNSRERFPVKSMGPETSYRYIYPVGTVLEKIAYFFEYEFEERLDPQAYQENTKTVADWQERWSGPARPSLTYLAGADHLQVLDERDPENPGSYQLEGALAKLYLAASERPHSAASAIAAAAVEANETEVFDLFQNFCDASIMMQDGDRFLALAIPGTGPR